MPMNQSERSYIEYRPSIREKIFALIPSDVEADKFDSLFPEAIKTQIDYPYIDTVNKMKDLLQNLNNMINNIDKALSNFSLENKPFSNYQKDTEAKELFDEYYKNNINRNVKGEVYPILLELKDGVNQISDFIAKDLFGVDKINLEDDEEIKKLENIESRKIVSTANNFINNEIVSEDVYQLNNKNELNLASARLLNKYEDIIDKFSELLNLKISDYFNSDIDSLVTGLSSASNNVLSQLNKISEIKFDKLKNELEVIKDRMTHLCGNDKESIYFNELIKINNLINDNREVASWMHELKTPLFLNGINDFLEETLDVIEDAFQEYDSVLIDLHRHMELKNMEYTNYINKLVEKEKSKQMYEITNDMNNYFDYEDKNKSKQIQRFINQYEVKEI